MSRLDDSLVGAMRSPPATVVDANARPITVALVNDYEIILRGLESMLAPHADRISVVEHAVGGTPNRMAEVALFDTFGGRRDALDRAEEMILQGTVDHVVLYTWDAAAEFLEIARRIGVSGVLLKSIGGGELVTALERVVAGERVGLDHVIRMSTHARDGTLSIREREVLALVAQGRTNREIADQLFLSVDTVKTYVRRLFNKLGVHNRTQAALLADRHRVAPRRDHRTGQDDSN